VALTMRPFGTTSCRRSERVEDDANDRQTQDRATEGLPESMTDEGWPTLAGEGTDDAGDLEEGL
jgi:hypothetical protein